VDNHLDLDRQRGNPFHNGRRRDRPIAKQLLDFVIRISGVSHRLQEALELDNVFEPEVKVLEGSLESGERCGGGCGENGARLGLAGDVDRLADGEDGRVRQALAAGDRRLVPQDGERISDCWSAGGTRRRRSRPIDGSFVATIDKAGRTSGN
jgi:hypothetical protein